MSIPSHLLPHLIAVLWFVMCWAGYTRYASWRGRDTACLASVLHLYRQDWMRRMLLRDNRIADANVIGNLERNAGFFASSTLIILAGVLTALGASERAVSLLADLPFAQPVSRGLSEIKLLALAVVFVYAFFTFSWCMRQYNFAAVLVASAPMAGERNVSELAERRGFERTTLTRNLDRLEKMELIASRPAEHGNGRICSLTPKGRALVDELLPLWRKAQAEIRAELGADGFEDTLMKLQRLATI